MPNGMRPTQQGVVQGVSASFPTPGSHHWLSSHTFKCLTPCQGCELDDETKARGRLVALTLQRCETRL